MESEPIRQKEQLTPKKLTSLKERLILKELTPFSLVYFVVCFGLCVVAISYILSSLVFKEETMQVTGIFVTAILGSAVTMATMSQILNKEKGKEGK